MRLKLAADTTRKIDPDLAETYWRLMTTKDYYPQALCATNRLASRILSVMRCGRPNLQRDRDGRELTVAEAKAIVTECFKVPEDIRASRRANSVTGAE